MRTLNPIIADYAGRVDFYLVAFNESAAELDEYIIEEGYANMTTAQPDGAMLRDLAIVSQSSMLALDAAGVIAFRKGYGGRAVDYYQSCIVHILIIQLTKVHGPKCSALLLPILYYAKLKRSLNPIKI